MPTTSVSFSTKRLSLESLNVSMRCGCKPCASQIRWTVDFPTPWAFAIVRTDQCVASFGVVCRVASTISFTLSAGGGLGAGPGGCVDRYPPRTLGRESLSPQDHGRSGPPQFLGDGAIGPALSRQ